MEKVFLTNKEIIKKIVVALIIIMTFNFIISNCGSVVFAADSNDPNDQTSTKFEPGGTILKPIRTFLLFIGDSIMGFLQKSFLTQQEAVIQARSSDMGGRTEVYG